MSVQKRHTGINKKGERVTGRCEATDQGKCPYGEQEGARHFYYDTSIRQEVLNPDSTTQRVLNKMSNEELHEKFEIEGFPRLNEDKRAEYDKAFNSFSQASQKLDDLSDKVLKDHPVPAPNFTQQLADASNTDMVGNFDFSDNGEDVRKLPKNTTEDELLTIGKAYLEKEKAETKFRATVSHLMHENNKQSVK